MGNNIALEKARQMLAEATSQDISSIPDDVCIDSYAAWDSLSHMRLILAMEAQRGQELPAEAILEISNLQDMVKYLFQ